MASAEDTLCEQVFNACYFTYVNEGAANIVFRVHISPNVQCTKNLDFLKGRLLRVQKRGTKAYSYPKIQEYWEDVIRPLFNGDDLVDQRLVKITFLDIYDMLNSELEKISPNRRPEFRQHKVEYSRYAMLVEDMSDQLGDKFIEFKPKWLAQSPNAPKDAIRCRTCALAAQRTLSRVLGSIGDAPDQMKVGATNTNVVVSTKQEYPKCPLALLALGSQQDIIQNRTWLDYFAKQGTTCPLTVNDMTRLWDWLLHNSLLPRLRELQVRFDPLGPLAYTPGHGDLPLAMTLRDCSLFIRIPSESDEPVTGKLADLDRKNLDAKLQTWKQTEKNLIQGGFYIGAENPPVETICWLQTTLVDRLNTENGWNVLSVNEETSHEETKSRDETEPQEAN